MAPKGKLRLAPVPATKRNGRFDTGAVVVLAKSDGMHGETSDIGVDMLYHND